MAINAFISHAHDEKELALAWKALIKATCAGAVDVWLSSDKTPEGGMELGEEWRTTIYDRLNEAEFVLAIVSPQSIDRPWILWECGVATGVNRDRKLVPIVYSMSLGEFSGPLSSYQAYSGEDINAVSEVCERLATKAGLEPQPQYWGQMLEPYKDAIDTFRPARKLQHQVFRLWGKRFDELENSGRITEIRHTVQQFYLSIGGGRPVDIELHERLSIFFLKQKLYEESLREIDYAISLLPDDTVLLHRKGLILIERGDLPAVQALIDSTFKAHPETSKWPELAGLEGRLYRAKHTLSNDPNHLQLAVAAYKRAFQANPTDHYPGGQACALALTAGDQDTVDELLPRVLDLTRRDCEKPGASFWADFTLGQMLLIGKDVAAAHKSYDGGLGRKPAPAPRERESALNGAKTTAVSAGLDIAEIEKLLSME